MDSTLENSTILYFVRHAESVGNATKTIAFTEDDVLTPKGKEQAEKLGLYLSQVPLTRAYSSDYPRTLETANLILKNSKHLDAADLKQDVRLREGNPGIYFGKTYEEALLDVVKANVPVADFKAPGVETPAEIQCRLENFLDEIFSALDLDTENRVLIVSHSLYLQHMMTFLQNSAHKYSLVNWSTECKNMLGNTSYMKIRLSKVDANANSVNDLQGSKWRLEFLEIHGSDHLGEEGLREALDRNKILKAALARTIGQNRSHIFSNCMSV